MEAVNGSYYSCDDLVHRLRKNALYCILPFSNFLTLIYHTHLHNIYHSSRGMSRKKNLMDGYYIVGCILIVFFTGSLFMFMDMVCNTEEEIVIHKPKRISNGYYQDEIIDD